MVGSAENLAPDGVYVVPGEGPILKSHKRRRGPGGKKAGAADSSSTSFVLARSWLTLKDPTGKELTLAHDAHQVENDEDAAWKITTDGLAKRLVAGSLDLQGHFCWSLSGVGCRSKNSPESGLRCFSPTGVNV